MPKVEPHIAYSPLTNHVYLVLNSKKKIDITPNFIRTVVLWMEQGGVLEPGHALEKDLADKDGNVLYKLELQCPEENNKKILP